MRRNEKKQNQILKQNNYQQPAKQSFTIAVLDDLESIKEKQTYAKQRHSIDQETNQADSVDDFLQYTSMHTNNDIMPSRLYGTQYTVSPSMNNSMVVSARET